MSLEVAINKLVERLEAVAGRLEKVENQIAGGAASSPVAASAGETPAWVAEYDELVASTLHLYFDKTQKIGNEQLKEQAKFFEVAIKEQRKYILAASLAKKPAAEATAPFLQPTSEAISKVIEIRDKARGNSLWNHLSAVSEAVPALGWVTIEPTPGPYAFQYQGNSEFYTNKLLREYKGKDEDQVAWIEGLNGFLKGLVAYIKKWHTTELKWNPHGVAVSAAFAQVGGAAASPAPVPVPAAATPAAAATAPVAEKPKVVGVALFSELSAKGDSVTSGLKKVTKDMKTKNRDASEKTSIVKAEERPVSRAPAKVAEKRGPARFELQGNKWVVEFQDNNKEVKISETEAKQTVYIYKCDNAVINISGKVNAVTLDSCRKTGVVFDTAIASFEIVNCTSVEVQVQNKVPSLSIDKCSGVQVYLALTSLDTEIVTSKSDQMNVLFPVDGEMTEHAIPEQYKTVVVKGGLHTGTIEHI